MNTIRKILALIALATVCGSALADPPGRVGRIAYTQGQVSFRNTHDDQASAAALNWPVTAHNVIATGPSGRAEIRVGSAAVRIDANSELAVDQLDDQHFKLYLSHGSISARVKSRDLAEDFELQTPEGLVRLSEPSRIRVDAERVPRTSTLNVFSGAAQFQGPDTSLTVRAGKRADISGDSIRMSDARTGDYTDDFDTWSAARDRRDEQSVSTRYVSPETTGYEELDHYGSWHVTTSYGPVWYPRMAPLDWAPYRAGRWAWIEPWGWTWVDSAPWGYAPFHYGRWVSLDGRWAWVPGAVVQRPVWAPALVGWVGGSNWSLSFSVGNAPAVGWFPLAPREVFVPSYSVSPTYVRQINVTHVTNITNINNVVTSPQQTNFQNRQVHNAVTVLPQDRFVVGKTVLVGTAPTVLPQAQHLQSAPVSALVPATIAHANQAAAVPRTQHEDRQAWRDAVKERGDQRKQERDTDPHALAVPRQASVPPRNAVEAPGAGTPHVTVVDPGRAQRAPPDQHAPSAAALAVPQREISEKEIKRESSSTMHVQRPAPPVQQMNLPAQTGAEVQMKNPPRREAPPSRVEPAAAPHDERHERNEQRQKTERVESGREHPAEQHAAVRAEQRDAPAHKECAAPHCGTDKQKAER